MKFKIKKFEYWPYRLFFAPFVPYWLLNSVKSGSFSYFCKVNPGIEFGGFLDYSKSKILAQIPEKHKPNTIFLKHKKELKKPTEFPFIVKPDFGERGVAVELISSEKDWENYSLTQNLIVQEYVDLPFEFGIFYAEHSGQSEILSITGKEFLIYKSDGKTSLRDFILSNPRSRSRAAYFLEKFNKEIDRQFPTGTEILLEPIGNHNRGTRFYDASELKTQKLAEAVAEIAKSISGFNYGRLDVKAASVEDLKSGKIVVLEVNGANSEPTHIYDGQYSLRKAYSEVKRHLDIQYEISKDKPVTYSPGEFYKAVLKRVF